MLSVIHQTKQGPKTYAYSTIGNQSINSYMCQWQQKKRRADRAKNGLSKYVHAEEVPESVAKEIVVMRSSGVSWPKIVRKFDVSDYIARKIVAMNSEKLHS